MRPVPPSIRLSKLKRPLEGVEMPIPASAVMLRSGKAADALTSRLAGRAGRPLGALMGTAPGSISRGRFTLVRTGAMLVGVGVSKLSVRWFERINLKERTEDGR